MYCRNCGSEMYLDDTDRRFKGNLNKYWCCEECQLYCTEEIRYSRTIRVIWHSEKENLPDHIIEY